MELLARGVANIYPTAEMLAKELMNGRRLTVYLGIDPTGPSLHLGHAIPMRKLAVMQKLGHRIILLIGDFTAMIGDPTDKMATRKKLTREQVLENCKTYKKQASKILDFDGSNPVELKFNSEWLGKMSFTEVVELASHFTVQQMMERDMFEKRIAEGKPVHLHEFLYPLMQGYDSVVMDVDLEVGGNDQTFNMLGGRTLMKVIKDKEKFVLTTKLLTDPTGIKMGKTEGNVITLDDAPEDMYGKVMSWSDGMIAPGFELCSDIPDKEIEAMTKAMEKGENPMTFKRLLARTIVSGFISEEAAEKAEEYFATVHQKHEAPNLNEINILDIGGLETDLVNVLTMSSKLAKSKTEARQLIEQGAIKIDGKVVKDINAMVHAGQIVQKGKRHFIRVNRGK